MIKNILSFFVVFGIQTFAFGMSERGPSAAITENNLKIFDCAERASDFLGTWIDTYSQVGKDQKGRKCFTRFNVDERGMNVMMNHKKSSKYISSLEMHNSSGYYVYPGIVPLLKKCSISGSAMEVRVNYHVPRSLAPRNPPFLDLIERQMIKIQKAQNGKIVSVEMNNVREGHKEKCFF